MIDSVQLAAGTLAGVWLIAAIGKGRDLQSLEHQFVTLGLPRIASAGARGLIVLEATLALLLIVPFELPTRLGAVAGAVSLAGFAALIGWTRMRARQLPCACFGPLLASRNTAVHAAADVILAGASLIVAANVVPLDAFVGRLAGLAIVMASGLTVLVTVPMARAFMRMET